MISEFTAEERAALSENSQLVLAMMEAEDRGDMAEADRCCRKWKAPPIHSWAIKEAPGGADWIRRMNLNTRLADEKYGPGWLDRTGPDRR